MGKTQTEGYEIIGKKCFDHIIAAGDKGNERAKVRADQDTNNDNKK
jgi:hypothetical protein